jgi:hypothetical protein
MRIPSLLLLCCLMATPVFASTTAEREFTCPLDGKPFKAVIAMSGTSFGLMLDMEPYGPIITPWPVAECPEDGMLLYKDFTEQDITVLRPYVLSPEYQDMRKNKETPYRRMAALEEKLGVPRSMLWRTLLQATWEARGEQYPRYAREAAAAIEEFLAVEKDDAEEITTAKMVYGELNRRLGDFQRAQRTFEALRDDPASAAKQPIRGIVDYQLELIKTKDTAPHQCPSQEK